MRRAAWLVALLLVGIVRGAVATVVPAGTEFQVNTYTTSYQERARICADAAGNFVVVWESYAEDGNMRGVFAQRYSSDGDRSGTEFQVNTYTENNQRYPAICCADAGAFVVTWQSFDQDGDMWGVFSQRFASSGAFAGAEFQVNTYTFYNQQHPAIACDSAGDFVVAWDSYAQDGYYDGIFAQRYASDGTFLGSEFQVNTFTYSSQAYPSIASDARGDFVVVWQSYSQDGDEYGVFGQRFDSAGAARGTEFQVNTYTTGDEFTADVAVAKGGNFVVVWESYDDQDGDMQGVFAQRYAKSGARQGTEFQVNIFTTDAQDDTRACFSADGSFTVVWESKLIDGSNDGVFFRRVSAGGELLGTEFQVNTYTPNQQENADIACTPSGFVVVWESANGQDGDDRGIFGQRFLILNVSAAAPVLGWAGLCAAAVGVFLAGLRTLRRRRR